MQNYCCHCSVVLLLSIQLRIGLRSMHSLSTLALCLASLIVLSHESYHMHEDANYTPDWESLDSRPLPSWYDEAKFGIFIHWGVWSVPAYGGGKAESAFLWEAWRNGNKDVLNFISKNYPPSITYADFAADFKAAFYDPMEWADIFKASGAKYVVFTSKHHEGFTNWPSSYSWNWNSMDVGPHRDIVGELANALRNKTDLRFGLYHSLFEFYHPLYLADKANKFTTQKFVSEKTMPELYEIVNQYKPEIVWSDGEWEAHSSYWNSTNFVAWLYNSSPVKDTVVTNDRWGADTMCRHGGYMTCVDKFNPGVLQPFKWENCLTLDRHSWGYRRNMQSGDILSMKELTRILAETISCGGNMLLNVGPTSDGGIVPVFEERLRQMGEWLKVNGEAVYSSKPWKHQNDTLTPGIWFTSKGSGADTSVYAFILDWPASGTLTLNAVQPSSSTVVSLLGYKGVVTWYTDGAARISVIMPLFNEGQRPCDYAWVLKFTNVTPA